MSNFRELTNNNNDYETFFKDPTGAAIAIIGFIAGIFVVAGTCYVTCQGISRYSDTCCTTIAKNTALELAGVTAGDTE